MLKNIGWLFFANLTAQLVQLIIQPILTRYYGPAEFNLLGQILSLATILVIAGNLQLHTCMPVSQSEKERDDLLNSGLGWLTVFSILTTATAALTSIILTNNYQKISQSIYLGIMVWILGTANLILGYYSGSSNFRAAGYFSIKRVLFTSSIQIALAFKPIGNGLILGLIGGEFSVRASSISILKKISFHSWTKKLTVNLKKYRDFTLFGTIQESVSVSVLMLPLFSFGLLYGDEVGGNYVFAYRMTWAPGMLIAASISPVLLRHLASIKTNTKPPSGRRLLTEFCIIFTVCAAAFFYALTPIIDWWLDARWDLAIKMMGPIALWVSAYLSALKVRQLYRVHKFQRWQLLIDFFVASAMAIIFFAIELSVLQVLMLSSILGVIQNLSIVILYSLLRKNIKPEGMRAA